jgi:hypothetical protein
MYPGDDYGGGVVVELLPDRRCRVRLNDGREIVGCIPYFCGRHNEPYYPAVGHAVTVFMQEYDGEFLLVGFPHLRRRATPEG